jgi:hypothetical protein
MAKKNFKTATTEALTQQIGDNNASIFDTLPNANKLGITVSDGQDNSPLDKFLSQTSDTIVPNAPPVAVDEPPAPPPVDLANVETIGDPTGIPAEQVDAANAGITIGTKPIETPPPPPLSTTAQVVSDTDNSPDSASPEVSSERLQRRRQVIGKWSSKFLDAVISGGSNFAHQAFVLPASLREEFEQLSQIKDLNNVQKDRLQYLSRVMLGYQKLAEEYTANSQMDAEDRTELQACIADVMESEEVTMSPWVLIGIMLLFQIVSNTMGIFFDKMKLKNIR